MSIQELQNQVRLLNAKAGNNPALRIDVENQSQSQICERMSTVLGHRAVPGFVTEDVLDQYVVRLSNELVEALQEYPTAKNQLRIEALRALGADERKATLGYQPLSPAVKKRSGVTESNKTLKMMIGRVLSAYRQGKLKKDGTPLYLSYLDSLRTFVEANPESATLEQLAAMYAEIGPQGEEEEQ